MTAQLMLSLPPDLDPNRLPRHVAAIMDGNGRWAMQRGLPRIEGHRRGVSALKEMLRTCKDWGIQFLTVYAFSTENWRRPDREVRFLMGLFERLLQQELAELQREGVCIQFLGELSELSPSLRQQMLRSMEATAHNHEVYFNIALNYGSQREIVRACRHLAEQACQGHLDPAAIDEQTFAHALYTAGHPDPDLLIRTSGEMRLSNFLLWQLAYTEIYVTETLWPDFDRAAFHGALRTYQNRDRRFGKLQPEPSQH